VESILTSIKKLLGIAEDYTHFDPDIIVHINSAFSVLTQLGVGPTEGFSIEDDQSVWSDFVTDDSKIKFIKTFIHLKVKLYFDPPLSTAAIESTNNLIKELEWRIQVAVDPIESVT
jgi:hypothetical protein